LADKISVLLVDDIASTLDNLRKLLSFEEDIEVVATATSGKEAMEEGSRLRPDIILMDVNMPDMDGIEATEALASAAPASPVIIMSVQGERDYLRRAMQAGAREFLIKPFSGDELIASIRRVHQLEERKEMYSRGGPQAGREGAAAPAPAAAGAAEGPAASAVAETEAPAVAGVRAPAVAEPEQPATGPLHREAPPAMEPPSRREMEPPSRREEEEIKPPTEPPPSRGEDLAVAAPEVEKEAEAAAPEIAEEQPPALPPEPPPPPRVIHGELIVLFGGKGGIGKSVLATNVACSLASETGARVGLVDLDLQFGDLAVLLNLPQVQSIADLIENPDQIDSDFLLDVMIEGPSGVWLLPTAPNPELADLVTPEHVQVILSRMRSTFDFIVIDTSSHLGDVTLTALDMASRILLISAQSIPSVKNAKLALRLFETLQIPPQTVTLVLNRCEAHTEFNKEAIESNLKFPVSAQIPHDPRTVVNSINRGTPFVTANPEVEISQRVRQLVGLLLPAEVAVGSPAGAKPRRRFGRR